MTAPKILRSWPRTFSKNMPRACPRRNCPVCAAAAENPALDREHSRTAERDRTRVDPVRRRSGDSPRTPIVGRCELGVIAAGNRAPGEPGVSGLDRQVVFIRTRYKSVLRQFMPGWHRPCKHILHVHKFSCHLETRRATGASTGPRLCFIHRGGRFARAYLWTTARAGGPSAPGT